MKNFKQIAFGLIIGVMAISFSSFTNANTNTVKVKKAGMNIDAYLVQDQGAGGFSQSSSFDVANCGGTASLYCGYDVTASGQANIPNQSSYSAADISSYVTAGYIVKDPSATVHQYTD